MRDALFMNQNKLDIEAIRGYRTGFAQGRRVQELRGQREVL